MEFLITTIGAVILLVGVVSACPRLLLQQALIIMLINILKYTNNGRF
jgi:hypothetical protein